MTMLEDDVLADLFRAVGSTLSCSLPVQIRAVMTNTNKSCE